MFTIPQHDIKNPGLWYRDSLVDSDWRTTFPDEIIEELTLSVTKLRHCGLQAPYFRKQDFPLVKTIPFLTTLNDELENGLGFRIFSGFPITDFKKQDRENLFWGLGLHIGQAVPINADGALLGHVQDLGLDIKKPHVRNYQTTEELTFHNDTCDVLGLMCLQVAKLGGESAIASAVAIHNEILKTRPDLLHELYQPFAIDRRGEQGWPAEGSTPWFALPVFSYYHGKLTSRYTVHDYYYQSQRFNDAPKMSAKKVEALEYLKSVSQNPNFQIQFSLQPGDMQFVNNYCVFHARTQFEDDANPAKRRHLLRLWLSVANSRSLHPIFTKRYRSVESGAIRGGIAPRASS